MAHETGGHCGLTMQSIISSGNMSISAWSRMVNTHTHTHTHTTVNCQTTVMACNSEAYHHQSYSSLETSWNMSTRSARDCHKQFSSYLATAAWTPAHTHTHTGHRQSSSYQETPGHKQEYQTLNDIDITSVQHMWLAIIVLLPQRYLLCFKSMISNTTTYRQWLEFICHMQGVPIKTTPQKKSIISVTVKKSSSPNLQLLLRIQATYAANFVTILAVV